MLTGHLKVHTHTKPVQYTWNILFSFVSAFTVFSMCKQAHCLEHMECHFSNFDSPTENKKYALKSQIFPLVTWF